MLPRVGSRSPVSSRNRVVFPVPFRPTMPQRSPGATVKETSENRFVAPKSTPTLVNAIWVRGGCYREASRQRRRNYGGTHLFSAGRFTVALGERWGIIGRN